MASHGPGHPTMTIITRVPLPSHLDPQAMLDTLQTYEPLIKSGPYLKNYERRAVDVEELIDDTFFSEQGRKIQAFVVYERVPIIPGVGQWATKTIKIPCVFQSFQTGVRCRADSEAGVTVRSSYEVRRRGDAVGGVDGPSPPVAAATHGEEYELVETADICCGSFVKAFVRQSFTTAHQKILQKMVDDTARVYAPPEAQQLQQPY